MARPSDIHRKQLYGRGKVAAVLGQPWDVYRIGAQSQQNFIRVENRLWQSVPARYTVGPNKKDLEAEKVTGIILYEIDCDLSRFSIAAGDVFICEDLYQPGHNKVSFETLEFNGFCLAQDSVNKKTIGARLTRLVTLGRSIMGVNADGRFDPTTDNIDPIFLKDGRFGTAQELALPGNHTLTPARIPIGLVALTRPYGDRAFENVPGQPRKSGFSCYVPPLPGFRFREGDRILGLDDARYRVLVAYDQETGFVGSQMFLEREVAQG